MVRSRPGTTVRAGLFCRCESCSKPMNRYPGIRIRQLCHWPYIPTTASLFRLVAHQRLTQWTGRSSSKQSGLRGSPYSAIFDKDQFELVLCIDTLMSKYGYEVSCNGICFRMCVEREGWKNYAPRWRQSLPATGPRTISTGSGGRPAPCFRRRGFAALSLLPLIMLFGVIGPVWPSALPIGGRRGLRGIC